MNVDNGETSFQDEPTGYSQQIDVLKNQLDINLSQLSTLIESLRNVDLDKYNEKKSMFDGLITQYNALLSEAISVGGMSDPTVQDSYITNLAKMLDYTNQIISELSPAGSQVVDQNGNVVVDQPIGSSAPNAPSTAMVASSGQVNPSGQTIQMVNVGPVRAWWERQSDDSKLLFKALAVGALIYGGKYLFNRTKAEMTSKPKQKTKTPKRVIKHDDEYDDDYEENEATT